MGRERYDGLCRHRLILRTSRQKRARSGWQRPPCGNRGLLSQTSGYRCRFSARLVPRQGPVAREPLEGTRWRMPRHGRPIHRREMPQANDAVGRYLRPLGPGCAI